MRVRSLSDILLCAVLLSLPACGPGDAPAPPTSRSGAPNVIVIVMDTTAASHCSLNGYDRPTTPELEKIAKGSMHFRNAWSPSPWTAPAHASMFTGLRPEHHGLHFANRLFLWEERTTLAERMQAAGYQTGCFTNNSFITAEYGLAQGFDHYVPLFLDENLGLPTAKHTHAQALDWARHMNRQNAPFFLFLNDMEAHLLYVPPEEFAERFLAPDARPEDIATAQTLPPEAFLKHNLGVELLPPAVQTVLADLYDGAIACLDHEIGQFVAELDSAGLLDNTLLVITSDHGENVGEHGLFDHKFSVHRTLLHVPLIVRLPRGERAGEVHDEVVRLEDLFPTILAVCGVPIPPGIDGETLLGDLPGRIARAMLDYPAKYLDDMEEEMGGRAGYERVGFDLRSEFDGRFHRIDYSDGRKLVFDVLEDPRELNPIEE